MYRTAKTAKAHSDAIWDVCWTNSNLIATASVDHLVKVISPDELETVHSIESHELSVLSVVSNTAGTVLATSTMGGFLRTFDVSGGGCKPLLRREVGSSNLWKLAYLPKEGNSWIATGTHKGAVTLFPDLVTEDGPAETSVAALDSFCMSVAFSPDGRYLAAGGHDGTVALIDVESQKVVGKLTDHKRPVRALTFSPDSTTLVTGSDSSLVHVYSVASQELTAVLASHSSWVLSAAFNPKNSNQLCTSSSDKKIKVWDLPTREIVHTFGSHSDQVWSLAFDPTGTKLASVSDDATLQIHDCHE